MSNTHRHSNRGSWHRMSRAGWLSPLVVAAVSHSAAAQGESALIRNKVCTLFGGLGEERVQGISIMANGRILVAGETTSTDFQAQFGLPNPPPYATTNYGNKDAYVAILNAQMTAVLKWTYFGGPNDDRAYFAMEGPANTIWVCGFTDSGTGFPLAQTNNTYGSFGGHNAYVARFSADLSQLEVATTIGGSGDESPRGTMWVDSANFAVYISGATDSLNFPVSFNASGTDGSVATTVTGCPTQWPLNSGCKYCINSNPRDVFVAKFNSTTGILDWARALGGDGDDNAWGNVRVDSAGNPYIAGGTRSPFNTFIDTMYDNPIFVSGPSFGTRNGPADAFVVKLDRLTARVTALAYVGGGGTDTVAFNDCLELDGTGRPVIAGLTRSTDLPWTANALNTAHSLAPPADCDEASNDICIAKLKTDLTGPLVYCSYVNQAPGSSQKAVFREECAGLAIDGSGDIFLTGETDSSGFPITSEAFDGAISFNHTHNSYCPPPTCPAPTDYHDSFLIRLHVGSTSSTLLYGTFFGGDAPGGGATEAGNRGRSLSILTSGAYAGMAIFSGVTTASDFELFTTANVVQPVWLQTPPPNSVPDMRAGFIAIHNTSN